MPFYCFIVPLKEIHFDLKTSKNLKIFVSNESMHFKWSNIIKYLKLFYFKMHVVENQFEGRLDVPKLMINNECENVFHSFFFFFFHPLCLDKF